jgi:hypothetical protein
MTESYRSAASPPECTGTPSPVPAREQSTADVAKGHAAELSPRGAEAGNHLAGIGRDQATGVAAQAGRQGKSPAAGSGPAARTRGQGARA